MPCRGSMDISGLLWEVPVAPKVQRVSCLLVCSLLFMDVPVLLASFIQHLQVWSCGFHPEQGGVSASVKEFKFESETGDYVKDDLCSHPHMCPGALGGDQTKEVTDKIWCERCLGPALERRAATPPQWKELGGMLRYPTRCFRNAQSGKVMSQVVWEYLSVSSEELEEVREDTLSYSFHLSWSDKW